MREPEELEDQVHRQHEARRRARRRGCANPPCGCGVTRPRPTLGPGTEPRRAGMVALAPGRRPVRGCRSRRGIAGRVGHAASGTGDGARGRDASPVPRGMTIGATAIHYPPWPYRQQSEGASVADRASDRIVRVSRHRRPPWSSSPRAIAGARELALDTEGASFHRFVDRIYLLQLSTRDRHAVIDPLPIGTPARLGALLEDPGRRGGVPRRRLRPAAAAAGLRLADHATSSTRASPRSSSATRAFGLAALLERFFDVKLDKKHQRADWSMRPLTRGHARLRGAGHALPAGAQGPACRPSWRRWAGWSGRRRSSRCSRARGGPTRTPGMRLPQAQGRARPEPPRARRAARAGAVARRRRRASWTARPSACSATSSCSTSRGRSPRSREALGEDQGDAARRSWSSAAQELLDAVQRGAGGAGERSCRRFPRARALGSRSRISTRASARSRRRATRRRSGSTLDPGVLCSRDRMEAVARAQSGVDRGAAEVTELRRWQAGELGRGVRRRAGAAPPCGRGGRDEGASRAEGDASRRRRRVALQRLTPPPRDPPASYRPM